MATFAASRTAIPAYSSARAFHVVLKAALVPLPPLTEIGFDGGNRVNTKVVAGSAIGKRDGSDRSGGTSGCDLHLRCPNILSSHEIENVANLVAHATGHDRCFLPEEGVSGARTGAAGTRCASLTA